MSRKTNESRYTKMECYERILVLLMERCVIPLPERLEIHKILEKGGLYVYDGRILRVEEIKELENEDSKED